MAAARVELIVWPPLNGDLKVGDSVKLETVAEAVSGPDGEYELTIGDLSALVPLTDTNGTVNFEVVASGLGGVAPFNFSKRLILRGGELSLRDCGVTEEPGSGSDGSAVRTPAEPVDRAEIVDLTLGVLGRGV